MNPVDAKYALPFETQFHQGRAQQEYIYRILREVHTAKIVKVLTVGEGNVTVQPLALQMDTNGAPLVEAPIHGVPWLRMQAGASALILDPAVGDIGLAVFCDRDTTGVVAQKAASLVGSARSHSEMDGFYIGGVLNSTPTQYVRMVDGVGIDIVSPNTVTLQAPEITIQADHMTIQANVDLHGTFTQHPGSGGAGTATFAAPIHAPNVTTDVADFNTHVHSDPQGGEVGPPHNP